MGFEVLARRPPDFMPGRGESQPDREPAPRAGHDPHVSPPSLNRSVVSRRDRVIEVTVGKKSAERWLSLSNVAIRNQISSEFRQYGEDDTLLILKEEGQTAKTLSFSEWRNLDARLDTKIIKQRMRAQQEDVDEIVPITITLLHRGVPVYVNRSDIARQYLDLVSLETVQNEPMPRKLSFSEWETAHRNSEVELIRRAALHALADEALDRGLSIDRLRELIESELAATGQAKAARETTRRAAVEQRPKLATAAQTFAEAAAKSSRRKTRHVFTEAELRDPDAVNRARDTLSDIETARNNGRKISDEQRQAGNRAKAFIRKVSQYTAT